MAKETGCKGNRLAGSDVTGPLPLEDVSTKLNPLDTPLIVDVGIKLNPLVVAVVGDRMADVGEFERRLAEVGLFEAAANMPPIMPMFG